jgi:hypothetical protein
MSKQSKALRLADAIGSHQNEISISDVWDAADELRRLHAVNAELLAALKRMVTDGRCGDSNYETIAVKQARAAIANATKEQE